MLIDASLAYAEVSERLSGVFDDLAEDGADAPVPACPGWSVRDVLAHHCGLVVDIVSGRLAEFVEGLDLLEQWRDQDVARARDALTARQVSERQGCPLGFLLGEWRDATETLLPMLRGEQPLPDRVPSIFTGVVINDVVVHEGDIRMALGLDRAPDGPAMSLALAGYSFSLDLRLRALGLPPLALDYDGKHRHLGGEGPPGATLRATRFDLVRTFASRRTAEEILACDWSGDPEPLLAILPEYGPIASPQAGSRLSGRACD